MALPIVSFLNQIHVLGTPEIGGLTPIQALEIIRGCRGLNIVGGDLVEVGLGAFWLWDKFSLHRCLLRMMPVVIRLYWVQIYSSRCSAFCPR